MAIATTMSGENGLQQAEFPLEVVVCAWCKPKSGAKASRLPAWSHGICPRHFRKMREKIKAMSITREVDAAG